jgi:hypothetical protein
MVYQKDDLVYNIVQNTKDCVQNSSFLPLSRKVEATHTWPELPRGKSPDSSRPFWWDM